MKTSVSAIDHKDLTVLTPLDYSSPRIKTEDMSS